MSGLAALAAWRSTRTEPRALVGSMLDAAAHRGPEGRGLWAEGGIALGHLLLAATPGAATQPLVRGSLALVADLRLDDREGLARRLRAAGAAVDPQASDAELVLEAYRRWSVDCPVHLLGDFAFVLWDRRRGRLLAARDPLGVKPLHYAAVAGRLALASEAGQLLRLPWVGREPDELFLGQYLAGSVAEERTGFRQVRWLPSGHRLVAERGRVAVRRFWELRSGDPEPQRSPEDYADELGELLEAAVRARLRTTERVVGLQLSGGLDSSTVAALAHGSDGLRLMALSAVFDRLGECDERAYLRRLTAELGVAVDEFRPEQLPLLEGLEAEPSDLEGPFQGWRALEQQMLARLRDAGGRVLLTGHGGDSTFYGSPLLYADLFRQGRWIELAAQLRRHARERQQPPGRLAYLYLFRPLAPAWADGGLRRACFRPPAGELPEWVRGDFARRVGLAEHLRSIAGPHAGGRGAREGVRLQASRLGSVAWGLYWIDRTAARFGIEARHPLLDRRLVEFAARVPPELHYRAGRGKLLLRRAMRGRLPAAVRERPDKTSFLPFLRHRLAGAGFERLEQLLDRPLLAEMGIVDGAALRAALGRWERGERSSLDRRLWLLLTAEVWARRNLRATGAASGPLPGVSAEAPAAGCV